MAVGKRVKVVQDQSVALEVYVAGYPIPTESQITWYYPDNTPIVGSTAEEVKFERGRKKLILSDVQPDQAGLYSCQVEISLTPYLGAKTDVHLEVLGMSLD